ncbi:MAG TPA: hypothetical protein VJU86_08420 [Pyrinomonadaceae bacterium]|nr:hypothetical protein [Pyrinomonadaceae bacterium]
MITGFNTDIEHDGVVYHVQTEDKGLDTPLILSLVYTGGEILASKRSPYEDLIASGFDEDLLAQRLKRQHRLICAAINAGRIDDLKRMSGRPERKVEPEPPPAEILLPSVSDNTIEETAATETGSPESDIRSFIVSNADDQPVITEPLSPPPPLPEVEPPVEEVEPEPPVIERVTPASAYTVHDSRRQSPLGEKKSAEKGMAVTILEEVEYRAGQTFNIRVLVEKHTGTGAKPMGGVQLSVKILGTTFRPQLYSVKTGKDGVAVIAAQIPRFTSGRAAILIRADAEGKSVETRRVIHAAL